VSFDIDCDEMRWVMCLMSPVEYVHLLMGDTLAVFSLLIPLTIYS
jgi:hypothetical protein